MSSWTSHFSSQQLCRDMQLNEREAAVALREQRVGRMDSELLATFGALPDGSSSSSKEARLFSPVLVKARYQHPSRQQLTWKPLSKTSFSPWGSADRPRVPDRTACVSRRGIRPGRPFWRCGRTLWPPRRSRRWPQRRPSPAAQAAAPLELLPHRASPTGERSTRLQCCGTCILIAELTVFMPQCPCLHLL